MKNPYNVSLRWKPGITFIYAMCEPGTDEVRYVGRCRCGVRSRWYTHLAAARRGKTAPVSRWIAGLLADGKEPRPIMLTECPRSMEKQVERAWVHLFQDNGYDLLNVKLVRPALNGDDKDGAQ